MSNIDFIHEEKAADIGNFLVGRLLPFRQKRSIGPFVFIDHMGPACLADYENLDVPPHPHIGLSTLTYLFEGAIMHRDSMGTEVEIQPGAVNWMTAGKGVAHSERTPEYLRRRDKSLHGLQIWVALPKSLEFMEPEFFHIEVTDIPDWEEDGVQYKLIAGEAFGKKSTVPIYSPLYMIEIKTKEEKLIDIGTHLFGESGLYILEGEIENQGHTYGAKQILITKDAHLCSFTMKPNTTVYIFGGEPFPEERFIFWNFVATSKDIIEKAKDDWRNHRFPKVTGDDGYVPLPETRLR
ncbi:pirin family protein [Sphingobacterium chuzhouense]|uniref:Pirin family protein n=1 Tax=Sphingobacterium chuzhouense TaxID=1742264 RepID=A0ABR7XMJ7_9SPHI|nr:pirin family protein [Sphingobacterium chuzhouense]MBD1420082.1 pirin family protein [Sphingobacterium chuzhouense]